MLQKLEEKRGLQVLSHRVKRVRDRGRGCDAAHLDRFRAVQDLVGENADVVGHGGREHEVLPLVGKRPQDLPHVGEKAHVEHLVRLVQHKHLDLREVDRPLGDVIQKAAGTGDHDIGPFLQSLYLGVDVYPAVDSDAFQPGLLRQGDERFVDLLGELAGRGKHEAAQPAALTVDQAVQHGKAEGGRLAGAGLGEAQDVLSGHDRRDCLQLDGCRGEIPHGLDACLDLGVKIELFEIHYYSCFLVVAPQKTPEAYKAHGVVTH